MSSGLGILLIVAGAGPAASTVDAIAVCFPAGVRLMFGSG